MEEQSVRGIVAMEEQAVRENSRYGGTELENSRYGRTVSKGE